jgi:hypothetical protein
MADVSAGNTGGFDSATESAPDEENIVGRNGPFSATLKPLLRNTISIDSRKLEDSATAMTVGFGAFQTVTG